MNLTKRALAEVGGTFWLVLGGCGSAVLAAGIPELGLGYLGVSLAFGLNGCHHGVCNWACIGLPFKPRGVDCLVAGGRFKAADLPYYIAAQVLGAILACLVIRTIAGGAEGYMGGLASNGFGEHSPHGYSMMAGLVCEIVMTALFLFVIMGATDKRAPAGFAPLAIGLMLTLIHLISIPVTNTSVNPARSTGPALLEGGIALDQLWLFWVAPIIGGVIGAVLYNQICKDD